MSLTLARSQVVTTAYDWVAIVAEDMLSVARVVSELGLFAVAHGIAVVSGVACVAAVVFDHFAVVVEGYATAVVVIVEI